MANMNVTLLSSSSNSKGEMLRMLRDLAQASSLMAKQADRFAAQVQAANLRKAA